MRKTLLTMILAACCLILAAQIITNYHTADQNKSPSEQEGVYHYGKQTSPFAVDFYMCGQWEYYPGLLIYSDENGQNFQGGIGEKNPIPEMDAQYLQDPEQMTHTAQVETRAPESYRPEEMKYISVPGKLIFQQQTHPWNQVSSYRMVIAGLPPTEDFDMILGLQGLVYGDYETYIDGHLTPAMLPPYGYPTYYFPVSETGSVEIVIQTRNTGSLLNIAPRVSFKGTAMESFDSYRNALLIIIAILFTAIILMMVLMFSLDRKMLYIPFFTGILMTVQFLINYLWATGYQGRITSVIPQYLIPHIAWLMLAGSLALVCLMCRNIYPEAVSRRVMNISLVLPGAAVLCRMVSLVVIPSSAGILVSDSMILLTCVILLVLAYRNLNRISRSAFLFLVGFFLMCAGSVSALMNNQFGFRNVFLYFQPLTIMIFTALVFYNNKSNQIHLLARTRELLEVEKQASKIQTAMLSSQIQPHFLYNTLTSIQELCYSDPDEAADLIVTFSKYLRTNLDFMNYEELIPFSKELDHIHNYMYIENARYKNAIEYAEEIEYSDFLLPPLSVQPIVENAVKHGIMKENAKGRITLEVFRAEHAIHILVKNDGQRFTEKDLRRGHSMDNIRTRLKQLVNGELLFHFEDSGPEMCVEVIIPQEP